MRMVYGEVDGEVVKKGVGVGGVDETTSFLAIKRLQKYYKNKLALF